MDARVLRFPSLLLLCASTLWAAEPEPLAPAVVGFLNQHCTGCHDASESKGGVQLEWESIDWTNPVQTRVLERVHRVLETGEMPPKKKPRPASHETASVLAWIDTGLVSKKPPNATPARRLNRAEYLASIRRHFLANFSLTGGFPEDTRSHGFDNVAEALTLSPPLLEAYGETAARIADQIIRLPRTALLRRELFLMKHMSLQQRDFGGFTTRFDGKTLRFALQKQPSELAPFEAPVSGMYRVRLRAAAVHPPSEGSTTLNVSTKAGNFPVSITSTEPKEYSVDVPVYERTRLSFDFEEAKMPHLTRGLFAKNRPLLRKELEDNPRLLTALLGFHRGTTDKKGAPALVLKPEENPEGKDNDDYLFRAVEEAVAKLPANVEKPTPEQLEQLLDAMEKAEHVYSLMWNLRTFKYGPAIDLFEVDVEGPLEQIEGPAEKAAARQRYALFGTPPGEPGADAWLQHCAGILLRKTLRRTPTDAERDSYAALGKAHLAEGHSPDEALHLMLRAALVSPHFLYREIHEDSGLSLPHLASRLSYLLALAPPDGPLLKAAEDGSLSRVDVFRSHALRLLDSPDTAAFIKNFCGQWLGTRVLPQISPAPHLGKFEFPHLDGYSREPEMVFEEVLKQNRPVTDLIDPDFTFTNAVVGEQIYGIQPFPMPDGVKPRDMVRVSLPRGGRRGGLLGMAGVHMATANGVDTQPVVRGKWVMENILGDPPPPPPPSVPAITPDTSNAKTIRELMGAHTREESCAGCHRKLDPPGFLLENFDAIGNWRENYPGPSAEAAAKANKQPGPKVDASATFPDGTPLRDVTELKKHVVTHGDQFARCVCEKFFLYGTGRVPDYAERKAIREATARVLAEGGGFRDLLLAVLELEAFRNR